MERVVVAVLVVAGAAALAAFLRRRRADVPTQPAANRTVWPVPVQLDRADFAGPDAPWLVAVFSSATCLSFAEAIAKAQVLACDDVVVEEVAVESRRDVHTRYGIEAVPTIVVADADGVVRASFVGLPSATDLWAAVAEARQPGSSPEPDLGRDRSSPP